VPPRERRAQRGRPRTHARPADGAAEAESGAETRSAPRGIWSGTLSFGLVTVPIELYSALRPARDAALRMLAPDGTPLVRQYVCPAEDRALERDEIVRGYEVAPDEFVVVSDEELEALAPRRSRDIELLRFVERDAIDPSYFIRAYYLVPSREQTKAYQLLAETMEATGRAAIASFVMRDKAYAVAIFAEHGILRAQTLRLADELRSARDVGLPRRSEAERARVREMADVIEALERSAVDPEELQDPESEKRLALAREKHERGRDVVEWEEAVEPEAEEGAEVVDLLALLKERLRASGGRRAAPQRARRTRGGSASARRTGERKDEPSKQELLAQARRLEIPGRSRMSRAELARAVRDTS
jgi:DNA end-binding protein Ku